MTSLINKSNHPVNIKKIHVRVWTLREEIEACIQERIKAHGPENVDIEDIKAFYSQLKPRNAYTEDTEEGNDDQNFQPGIEDSSDMEEDSDMDDMAKAMAGEDPEENGSEGQDPDEAQAKELTDEVLSDQNNPAASQSSFKRVLPSEDKMIYGFAFLSEIHMEQILFFGKRPYTNGQTIIIEFLIPNNFSLSAEVQNSLSIDRGSRIISQTKPSHRVQGSFLFLFDGERASLRDFLKSVEPEVPPPPRRLKQVEKDEDDDDDFDDLGF